MILSFIHQKGGTGKSTLAVASALWLAEQGLDVMLLDADGQGTASAWTRRFGASHFVRGQAQIQRLVKTTVDELRPVHEWILIDSPPTVTPLTEQIIEVSDLLIVPLRPTAPDVWALDRLLGLALVCERHPPPPALAVFAQCAPDEAERWRPRLQRPNLTLAQEIIPSDPAWPALFEGRGLSEAQRGQLASLMDEAGRLARATGGAAGWARKN